VSTLDPTLEPKPTAFAGWKWSRELGDVAAVLDVARRHGLSPQQLFTWRLEARRGPAAPAHEVAPVFVPAVVHEAGVGGRDKTNKKAARRRRVRQAAVECPTARPHALRIGSASPSNPRIRSVGRATSDSGHTVLHMIYGLRGDAGGDRGAAQGLHPQMAAQASRRRRQPAGSWRMALHLHPAAAKPMAQHSHQERHRATAREIQATDQDADRAAIGRHCSDALLGAARLRPDQHAQS
jgi:hypothetical protein